MDSKRTVRSGLIGFLIALAAPSVLAAATQSPSPAAAGSVDPLVARQTAHPSGFPRILVLDDPGSPLVTFRLSVPLAPGVDAAAAAPIILALAEERIRGSAATLGAQIDFGATAFSVAYTVTGALADLDHLTYLLRQATAAPRPGEGFAVARSVLEGRLTRIGETGEGRIEAELRSQAAPEEASVAEVRNRLRRLELADVERIWEESHRPEQMTLVVVGDVAMPVLLAALSGLGAAPPPGPALPPLQPSLPSPDRPDLLRRWYGFGWSSSPTLDPRTAVAGALAARHLREERSGYEAYVRLWEGRHHDVLAVVGTAYPRDAAALHRRLSALPTELAETLDAGVVREVVERLRWTMMGQSRTPWGRANLVGRFFDTGAGPDAARRYIEEMRGLTADDMRSYLLELAGTPPVVAEVGP